MIEEYVQGFIGWQLRSNGAAHTVNKVCPFWRLAREPPSPSSDCAAVTMFSTMEDTTTPFSCGLKSGVGQALVAIPEIKQRTGKLIAIANTPHLGLEKAGCRIPRPGIVQEVQECLFREFRRRQVPPRFTLRGRWGNRACLWGLPHAAGQHQEQASLYPLTLPPAAACCSPDLRRRCQTGRCSRLPTAWAMSGRQAGQTPLRRGPAPPPRRRAE